MNSPKLTPEAVTEPATFASYLIFPLVLGVGLFCTDYFAGRVDNPISAAIVVSLSSMALIAALERILPYRATGIRPEVMSLPSGPAPHSGRTTGR